MNESKQPRRILWRIGAVLAGMFATVIPSIATDLAMYAAGIYPTAGESLGDVGALIATTHRTIYGIAGAYLTARLAPDRPMLHALVLGGLGFAASIAGAVATWNAGPAFGPKWYPIALIITALPTAWAGGKLRVIQLLRSFTQEHNP